ncbi:8268_t:CDS:1, partial [Entrophospora sp. SA101]
LENAGYVLPLSIYSPLKTTQVTQLSSDQNSQRKISKYLIADFLLSIFCGSTINNGLFLTSTNSQLEFY